MKKIALKISFVAIFITVCLSICALQAFAGAVGVSESAVTDLNDNEIEYIIGDNVKYTATVSNAEGIKLLAIIALKSEQGKLLRIKMADVMPDTNDDYKISVQMEDISGSIDNYVECFLWSENIGPFIDKKTVGFAQLGTWSADNSANIQTSGDLMTITKLYTTGATTAGYSKLAKYTLSEQISSSNKSVVVNFKIKGNIMSWSRTALTFNNEAYYAPFMIFTDGDLRFVTSRTPAFYIEQDKWYDIKMEFNPSKADYSGSMSYDYTVMDDSDGSILWQGNIALPSELKANYLPLNISSANICSRINTALTQESEFSAQIKGFRLWVETPPVIPTAVESVTITSANSVGLGSTLKLTANVTGTNNPSSVVSWSVEDVDGIATVSGNVLTPVSIGMVKVTATSVADPTKFDEMVITITETIYGDTVDSVTITSANTVEIGSSLSLTATVLGPDNPNPAVTWSVTAGTGSAMVTGSTLTPVSAGLVTVRATSVADPTKFNEMQITIKNAAPPIIWNPLDATVNVSSSGGEVVITKEIAAATETGPMYPSIARYTLPEPISTDGNSVTLQFTIKGEWLDWARIAMTFNTSAANLNNPPMFIQHDGKINFNWNSSTGVLEPSKWYVVTLVLNPTAAAYNASSMSYSYEVKEEASGTVFTSGTKTPASNEIITIIPQTLDAINWAHRIQVIPSAVKTFKITFKDFKIIP